MSSDIPMFSLGVNTTPDYSSFASYGTKLPYSPRFNLTPDGTESVVGGNYTGQFDGATGKMSLGDEIKNMNWFGSTNAQGIKQMGLADYGLGAIGAALNAYMGFKQLGMEKKKLAFAQQAHRDNFNAQANLTNANLSDRQATRNRDGFGENVATYMAKYGVKNV